MAWHARISASGMKRTLECPGSIALVETIPQHLRRGSGEAARLGTAAHGLGERVLRDVLEQGLGDTYGYLGGHVALDEHEDATVFPPDVDVPDGYKYLYKIDDDMCSAVAVYIDLAHEIINSIANPDILVEKTFDLDWLRPDLGGTGDLAVLEFLGTLYVVDYKHGQGVVVEVNDNKQMLTYGLGMAHEFDWCFEKLVLYIVQPRAPHLEGGVRRFETTKERLLQFRDELAAGYDRAMEAGAELEEARKEFGEVVPEWWADKYLKPGDHCTFCDAAGPLCPAMRRRASQIARCDFDDVPEDDDQLAAQLPSQEEMLDERVARQIAEVLDWIPALDQFIKAAKSLGFNHSLAGHKVPGHKLVEGRANRKYIRDEGEIVARVTEAMGEGFDVDRCYEPKKVKSPAQLEKISPRVKRLVNGVASEDGWAVEPLAAKGKGALSLVPDSNPKPAVTLDPNADFSGVEEEEE